MKYENIDIKKLQKFCKIMKKTGFSQNHKKRTKAINIVKKFSCVEEFLVRSLVQSCYFEALVKYYAKIKNFQKLNSNAFNLKIENTGYCHMLIITFSNSNFKLELQI